MPCTHANTAVSIQKTSTQSKYNKLSKYQLRKSHYEYAFPRSIETFLKQGITQDEATYKHSFYERQRKTQVNLVLDQLSVQMAGGSSRKLNSALTNLALPHEERVIRTAIRVRGKHELILGGSLQSAQKNNTMFTAPGGVRSGFNTRSNFYDS